MSLALIAQNAPGVTDNEVLDEYTIPFGNWIDEATQWANTHLAWLFDAIAWPFNFLLDVVVDNFLAADWMPWFVVVALIVLVGALTRNVRVGLVSGAAIAVCGLLGNDFWMPTVETIGMVIVAVAVCALIGIPLGVLSGRVDSVWNSVRPVLDGMQVVHPFVYLLPVIFFFGIGRTPGVLVTLVFALPPLVRLTNLGIRQVPEDVLEASRAYGAPERRVLRDVQLPLARPAIMTGLNQCLLMAISMVGIIALIAGGGLGQMVLRGVQTLNVPLAASAGLALYLVAVVLDRLSQREGDNDNLAARIARAWQNRKTPENLLHLVEEVEEEEIQSFPEPIRAPERTGALVAAVGAVLAIVGVFLPWGSDGSAVGGYPAERELDLVGTFNGLSADGGSWFGMLAFFAAVFVLLAAIGPLMRRADWPRALGPEGLMAAAATVFASSLGYLVLQPSAFSGEDFSKGVGVLVALGAAVVALVGSAIALRVAPYRARRVGYGGIRMGQLVAVFVAAVLALGGLFGSWVFDERSGVLPPDVQAQIDELLANAETDAEKASAAVEVASLSRSDGDARVLTGTDPDGPLLAWPYIALMAVSLLVGALACFPRIASGRRRWMLNALAFALAWGAFSIPMAWILSLVRISPPRYYSGAGTFVACVASALVIGTTAATFANWARRVRWTQSAEEAYDQLSEAA